ncbi:MAG: DUF4404 family protein [Cellvibrionaceae bacterium]
MSKIAIENLIGSLHERFGDNLTSPQQQQLMESLQRHVHDLNDSDPIDPDFQETLGILLEDVELQHPQAAGIIRELMEALKNMGI